MREHGCQSLESVCTREIHFVVMRLYHPSPHPCTLPGEDSFVLDDLGVAADDGTQSDGSASPRRRRRRQNKGRWKRMFVPNIVQKKLDFVAQTKKKMAKMQVWKFYKK